jgi:hypothetical protein
MRIASKRQGTVPQAARETAGLLPCTGVALALEDDGAPRPRQAGARQAPWPDEK